MTRKRTILQIKAMEGVEALIEYRAYILNKPARTAFTEDDAFEAIMIALIFTGESLTKPTSIQEGALRWILERGSAETYNYILEKIAHAFLGNGWRYTDDTEGYTESISGRKKLEMRDGPWPMLVRDDSDND